MKIQLGILI